MASTEPLSLGAPVSNEKTTEIDSTATGDPVLQAASIAHPSSETHKLAEQKVIGQELTKDGVVGNEKTDGGLGEVVVHVSRHLGSGWNQMQLRGSVAVGKDELESVWRWKNPRERRTRVMNRSGKEGCHVG